MSSRRWYTGLFLSSPMNTATVAWGLEAMSPFELRWQNTAWIFPVPSTGVAPGRKVMPTTSTIPSGLLSGRSCSSTSSGGRPTRTATACGSTSSGTTTRTRSWSAGSRLTSATGFHNFPRESAFNGSPDLLLYLKRQIFDLILLFRGCILRCCHRIHWDIGELS